MTVHGLIISRLCAEVQACTLTCWGACASHPRATEIWKYECENAVGALIQQVCWWFKKLCLGKNSAQKPVTLSGWNLYCLNICIRGCSTEKRGWRTNCFSTAELLAPFSSNLFFKFLFRHFYGSFNFYIFHFSLLGWGRSGLNFFLSPTYISNGMSPHSFLSTSVAL